METTATTTTTLQEDVMLGLNHLYPPDDLSQRNSMSRTDGYWSYISKGEEPPIHLTYGEFDFFFFADLLEKADAYLKQQQPPQQPNQNCLSGKTFVDIGSGTGRLVIGAAALHPNLKLCKGIEILPGIHDGAIRALEQCVNENKNENNGNDKSSLNKIDYDSTSSSTNNDNSNVGTNNANPMTFTNEQWKELSLGKPVKAQSPVPQIQTINDNSEYTQTEEKQQQNMVPSTSSHELQCPSEHGSTIMTKSLPLSPIKLSCGSFEDPYEYIGDADVVFVFSTCWTKPMMESLAKCIGRQCKPGTIAITTEFLMPLYGVVEAVDDHPHIPFGEFEMELVEKLDGYCGVTGGISTAYIHRVVRSLFDEEIDEKMKVDSQQMEKNKL